MHCIYCILMMNATCVNNQQDRARRHCIVVHSVVQAVHCLHREAQEGSCTDGWLLRISQVWLTADVFMCSWRSTKASVVGAYQTQPQARANPAGLAAAPGCWSF